MTTLPYFISGYFISPDEEVIEVIFDNETIKLSFIDGEKDIEFCNVMKHWWVTDNYALRVNGDNIELVKDNANGLDPVIYKRVGIIG